MRAFAYSRSRSARSEPWTPFFCTLMTTSSPVSSFAPCTCAIDAAASGVCSTEAYTALIGLPSSASMIGFTTLHGIGGVLSSVF